MVSVPSRGILFPNQKRENTLVEQEWVSVPSRGILFPNSQKMFLYYIQ